jgi:hypothetical protein
VIPAALDMDGMVWLRAQPQGLTVAAHGYCHALAADNIASEFHDLDLDEMRELLCLAQSVVGPTVHFVPPFNAIAGSTQCHALWHEGFRYVWGEPSSWPTPPEPTELFRDLLLICAWLPLYGASTFRMTTDSRPLTEVVPRALQLPGAAVLTLHLPWEHSRHPDFAGVRQLVDMIADHVISPEMYLQGPDAWTHGA